MAAAPAEVELKAKEEVEAEAEAEEEAKPVPLAAASVAPALSFHGAVAVVPFFLCRPPRFELATREAWVANVAAVVADGVVEACPWLLVTDRERKRDLDKSQCVHDFKRHRLSRVPSSTMLVFYKSSLKEIPIVQVHFVF